MLLVKCGVAVLLLVAVLSLCEGFHEVKLQRKPHTYEELKSAARKTSGLELPLLLKDYDNSQLAPDPWTEDVGVMTSHYYATIGIGTPPQPFSVLLRTDTTGLWVPSAMCPVETYDMCKHHRRYDRGRSFTYVRDGQMMGYGGMVAELSYDTVSLGGVSVTGQSFAEAIQYNYQDSAIPYDGLLGLDLGWVFSNDRSVFANLELQGVIDENVCGLYYLKNSLDPSKSGGLILGGRNSSLFESDLTYINSSYSVMWQFTVEEVMLLGSDMPPLCKDQPGGCPAVPITGTHFIISGVQAMDLLHRHLGATLMMQDHTYHFNCSALDQLQTIYFRVQETLLGLPWQSYVDKVMGPLGEVVCLSAFVASEALSDDLSGSFGFGLGDAFFTSVYVEFDVDRERMGLAQLNPNL